ncbi:MAG: hypothetical protein LQ347_001898 [Umbilicaria vellea]|nr:MAG: hypothetical protein LQ347_001898 [Umbilicaria vellea]
MFTIRRYLALGINATSQSRTPSPSAKQTRSQFHKHKRAALFELQTPKLERDNKSPSQTSLFAPPFRTPSNLSSFSLTSKPSPVPVTTITRLRTKHHTIEMAPPSKPASLTPAMETFVRQLAAKGEDARSITILLETEYPVMQGRKAVFDWVKGSVGR